MTNWYDDGEGSENMKRSIANDARNNHVTPGICVICSKVRENLKLQKQLVNSVDYGWKLEEKVKDLQHKVTVLRGINKLMETHHDTES